MPDGMPEVQWVKFQSRKVLWDKARAALEQPYRRRLIARYREHDWPDDTYAFVWAVRPGWMRWQIVVENEHEDSIVLWFASYATVAGAVKHAMRHLRDKSPRPEIECVKKYEWAM